MTFGTDNTAALRAMIAAAFAAGGGTMVFGPGCYGFFGERSNTSVENAVISIPDASYNGLTLRFLGSRPAPTLYNDFAVDAAPEFGGTIFYCPVVGSGTNPSFISANVVGAAFTHTTAMFENILFRTPVNPSIHVLNFRYGGGLDIDRCSFDVEFTNYSTMPVPTNAFSAVIFPGSGNSAWARMRRFAITGYYRAIEAGEHVSLIEGHMTDNRTGLFLEEGYGVQLISVLFTECIRCIEVDPESSYPVINAANVEFEAALAVGGNNLFNTTHIIHENRMGSENGYVAGTISGK
jgi:hypothetical protein